MKDEGRFRDEGRTYEVEHWDAADYECDDCVCGEAYYCGWEETDGAEDGGDVEEILVV